MAQSYVVQEDHDRVGGSAPNPSKNNWFNLRKKLPDPRELDQSFVQPASQVSGEVHEHGAGAPIPTSFTSKVVHGIHWAYSAISHFRVYPNSAWHESFLLVLILCVIYNTITIPFRLAFKLHSDTLTMVLDYAVSDVVYLLDIFFNMRSAYHDEGSLQTSKRRLMERYRRTGGYYLHIMSTFPLEIVSLAVNPSYRTYFRLNRVLRIFSMPKAIERIEKLISKNINVVRLVELFFSVMVYVHWVACFWVLIARLEGFDKSNWVRHYDVNEYGTFDQYIIALYWAMITFATVGYGDIVATTRYERIYTILVVFIGAAVYATIFGNMTNLIASLNSDSARYREKLDMLNEYMRYRGLPHSLQERIRNYYNVIWTRHKGLDESAILNDLPPSLRSDVALYLHHHLVQKVPLFQDCDIPGFINSLVVKLKPQVALPGDYIIRHGEIGREMYFLSRGKVEVISGDGKIVYATLNEGSYFGEIALLFEARRIAHIRTTTYCDLLMLTKDDFDSVLCYFPSLVDEMRQKAKEKIGEQRMKASERPPMKPTGRVSLVPLTDEEEKEMNRRQSQRTQGSKHGKSSSRIGSDSGSDSDTIVSSDQEFGSVFFRNRMSSRVMNRNESVKPLREISKAIRNSIHEVKSNIMSRSDSQVRGKATLMRSASNKIESFRQGNQSKDSFSDDDDMKIVIEDNASSAHGVMNGGANSSSIYRRRSPRADSSEVGKGITGSTSFPERNRITGHQVDIPNAYQSPSGSPNSQNIHIANDIGLSSIPGDVTTGILSETGNGPLPSQSPQMRALKSGNISGITAKRALRDKRHYRARWKALAYTAIANKTQSDDENGSMKSAESPRSVRSVRSAYSHTQSTKLKGVIPGPNDKDALRAVVSGFNTIQEEDNPEAETLERITQPVTFSKSEWNEWLEFIHDESSLIPPAPEYVTKSVDNQRMNEGGGGGKGKEGGNGSGKPEGQILGQKGDIGREREGPEQEGTYALSGNRDDGAVPADGNGTGVAVEKKGGNEPLIPRRMSYFNGEWIKAPKHIVDRDEHAASQSVSDVSDQELMESPKIAEGFNATE